MLGNKPAQRPSISNGIAVQRLVRCNGGLGIVSPPGMIAGAADYRPSSLPEEPAEHLQIWIGGLAADGRMGSTAISPALVAGHLRRSPPNGFAVQQP